MLDAVRQFLRERLELESPSEDPESAFRLATASLLFEVVRADYRVEEVERAAVARAVEEAFALDEEETERLVRSAEARAEAATSLFEFTHVLNASLEPSEKCRVVELLWRVAYADGNLDKYEEYIIRRVADLIHVSHADFIRAKLAVQAETGG